jgi:Kelch motif
MLNRRRFLAGTIAIIAAVPMPLAAQAPPSGGRWTTAAELPTPRSECSVAALGNSIYVVGGYVPAGLNPTVLEVSGHADVDGPLVQSYDVRSSRWTTRANLPHGLNHIGVVAFDGKLYTFGGFERQNRGAVSDANRYDPSADRWGAIAPLPAKRGSIAVAALGARVHLVGGRDEHSVGTHDVYDPATNRYTNAAPLPIGRDHMGLVAYGGKLYAIAGRIDDFDHNTSYADVYDPATDAWTSLPPMPSQRSGMAVALYRDKIFSIGGERGGGTFTNNEAFDPRTNVWTTYEPLPEGRHGTGAAVVDNRLYVPAGAPVNGGSRQSTTLFVFSLS